MTQVLDIHAILHSLYAEMAESNYDRGAIAEWSLGPDDYYDFLESWQIGHRRLRTWVNEQRAGETVTLTRKGAEMFEDFARATETARSEP